MCTKYCPLAAFLAAGLLLGAAGASGGQAWSPGDMPPHGVARTGNQRSAALGGEGTAAEGPDVGMSGPLLAYLPLVMRTGAPVSTTETVTLDLGGTWELAYSRDEVEPPTEGWTAVQVPSFVAWEADRPLLWFKRRFVLSGGFPREWVFLSFEGVKYEARIFLNGTSLGTHTDGFTPFELAVPPELLLEDNELVVVVSGWPSALAPEFDPTGADSVDDIEDGLIYAVGSQQHRVGIWQPVSLTGGRGVRVTDAYVRTSVRTGTIEVELTLHNPTDSSRTTRLDNIVTRRGATVLAFDHELVTVDPGEFKAVRLSRSWTSARLWSPDEPVLYELSSRLDDAPARRTAFGFRELWVEGNQILLNGIPIHLRGTATHPSSFGDSAVLSLDAARNALTVAKAGNNVAFRLHAQPWPDVWYEAADEVGILLVWESAYWCKPRSYHLEDPRFWANFREHLTGQLTHHRNHPSVVIWSLENELLLCSGVEPGATPRMSTAESELAALVDHIRRLDTDRPIMFDGDYDPGGRADIVNLHYPHEYPIWSEWPNEAWWLEHTAATDIFPSRIDAWPLAKPLYIGEFAWVPPARIEGSSIFFGDAVYGDPSSYYRSGKAEAWKPQLEAYRCLGVQGLCPWNIWEGSDETPNPVLYNIVKEKYAPNALFLREKNNRFYVDSPISRTAYLFNDRLEPSELTAEWRLLSGSAASAGSAGSAGSAWQARDFTLQPAEIMSFTMSLPAPSDHIDAVAPPSEPTEATLALRVVREGESVFEANEQVRLYERQPLTATLAVDLYDPQGAAAPHLAGEDVTLRGVTTLEDLAADAQLLIVASGGVVTAEDWGRIAAFARQGGRVLVLWHESYPPGVPLETRAGGATIGFVRQPSHPALVRMSDAELRYFAPDHVVFRRPLAKPSVGTYRVLVDAGSSDGLTRVGLLELPLGQGTVVCSQLDLLPRLDDEPTARRLLQSLLDYLAAYEGEEQARLAVVGASEAEESMLQAIGFDVSDLSAGPRDADVILAGEATAASDLAALLAEAGRGARLWLHRPSQSALDALAEASLPVASRPAVSGLVTLGPELRAAGLTDYSLFWCEERATRAGAMPPLAHSFAEMLFSPRVDWSGALTIEPSDFEVRSEAAYVGPDKVVLYTNGSIEADFEATAEGDYDVGILAEGTPVEGEYPLVRLQVDDETPTIVAVGELDVYGVSARLDAGSHRIALEFFNDRWEPPEDRNLTVHRMLVAEGSAEAAWRPLTQPAAMAEVRHGEGWVVVDGLNWDVPGRPLRKQELVAGLLRSWGVRLDPPAFAWTLQAESMRIEAGTLVTKRSEGVWFASNGTIGGEVTIPVAGRYTIRVLAAGTAVDGVYPVFEVAVDGATVGRGSISSESPAHYEVDALLSAGERHLSLAFVNDAYDPPQDRNLYVDYIAVVRR